MTERPADLFDAAAAEELARRAPLAARMRPRTLDDVVGQSHLLAPSAPFRRLIETDRLSSAVFFGPPGTGKTTIARLVATSSKKAFTQLSAVSAGVKDVRDTLESARRLLGESNRGTILFLDEIHRFSRSQQDALLPGVEDGVVTLIGATTENPYFSLNGPLLSRSTLWRFESLTLDELGTLIDRAIGLEQASITDEARLGCARSAEGDARVCLTTLEVALAVATPNDGRPTRIELQHIAAARSTRSLRFGDDEHYDMTSALIKSIRGSDPNAGVYWLARLLKAGEDPRFLARRLVILASEDVGMADPNALVVADAAASALDRVGLPEAKLNLAEAVVYLATAPKSNRSASAIWQAEHDVEHEPLGAVPRELRDAHYQGAERLGHGIGYRYPHDEPSGYVEADYLPEELLGRRYYEPSSHGFEAEVKKRLERLKEGERPERESESDERATQ